MKKYAVAVEGNYDSDAAEWCDTYGEAEALATIKAEKEKATVFIAEFIDGVKNDKYEEDEIEWQGHGYDANGNLKVIKEFILLVKNKKTGRTEYQTGCLHASIDALKEFYKDFKNLELIRAWEASEVEI